MKVFGKQLPPGHTLAATLVAVAFLVSVLSTAGAAEPDSTEAPPTETMFVFDQPISLSRVAGALREAGVVPVRFTHTGPDGEGGNHSRGLSFDEAIAQYQADYALFSAGEPQISSLTVDGSVSTDTLGGLAGEVAERYVLDTTEVAVPEPEVVRLQEPSEPPKLFSPEFGRTVTSNIPPSRGPLFGIPFPDRRMIAQEMTWASQDSINDFAEDRAYEHDFKLLNPANSSNSRPFCPPGTANNFWAQRDSVSFNTNFPEEIGPYLDTTASDECQELDFTIGLYHPNLLAPNVLYTTTIVANAGENDSSPYTLSAQKLLKSCNRETPFCVGINPRDLGEGELLVGRTRGSAPGCRSWRKGQDSQPCA